MKSFVPLAVAGLASCATAADSATDAGPGKPVRPNIVFILADDFGYMDIGANNPKTFYATPNIDALAAQGMRFTQGYATCPVCSPTRASLQTGKYPVRTGITDWIPGQRSGKLRSALNADHLDLSEVTIAEALKQAGYATRFIGKWHLGDKPKHFPDRQGYDVNIGGCGQGHPMSYFSPYKNPTLADGPKGEYLTDRLTEEAEKFIEASKDKPFFLFLSHYAVHTPLQAKEPIINKYREKAAGLPPPAAPKFLPEGKSMARQVQNHPVYAAMVESMDDSVGRVRAKLKALGLDGNTIVVFFSDNGGLSTAEGSPTANVPLRAGKGWLYEGGIREPWIVCVPGVTKPGSRCDTPVTCTDFYPTLLDLAGLPLMPKQHADGMSLVPLLRGGELQRGPLFWHYPPGVGLRMITPAEQRLPVWAGLSARFLPV